ncbi:hypothetical protein BC829DRAFT_398470, partial [Chytridium lagenaria]
MEKVPPQKCLQAYHRFSGYSLQFMPCQNHHHSQDLYGNHYEYCSDHPSPNYNFSRIDNKSHHHQNNYDSPRHLHGLYNLNYPRNRDFHRHGSHHHNSHNNDMHSTSLHAGRLHLPNASSNLDCPPPILRPSQQNNRPGPNLHQHPVSQNTRQRM